MRRSSAITLVILGATGVGAATYGISHIPHPPAMPAERCKDQQHASSDDSSCTRQHGSGSAALVNSGGGRRSSNATDRPAEDVAGPRTGIGPHEDEAAVRGVERGGFGEAGAAHGAGGGE